MIDVATLNVIRRWARREQMSIREISRHTGLARGTVKKYLRSDETEPTYARRLSPSKLDPYAEKLASWLGIEATKSRKQRRNLKQIYTVTRKIQVHFPFLNGPERDMSGYASSLSNAAARHYRQSPALRSLIHRA